jgi:hypothetical protein
MKTDPHLQWELPRNAPNEGMSPQQRILPLPADSGRPLQHRCPIALCILDDEHKTFITSPSAVYMRARKPISYQTSCPPGGLHRG